MADLCVCRHEEREHGDVPTCEGVNGVCGDAASAALWLTAARILRAVRP